MGISQEKKISFSQEYDYVYKEKRGNSYPVKMYASNNNEFLTKVNIKDFPLYFFTDALGTSNVSLDMNNHLSGLNLSSFYGYGYRYYDEGEGLILESKKLNTKETILGIPCSHYLIYEKSEEGDKDPLQLCIDDRSTSLNNFSILNGILNQFIGKTKINKSSGIRGFILKAGPKENYDDEYVLLNSKRDSENHVYFDHVKAMTEYQRKQDSIMLVYKNEKKFYDNDSTAIAVDSAAAISDDYMNDYGIPDYISEYKKGPEEGDSFAVNIIPSEKLWKGLPEHCQNFEKHIPAFTHKELKDHVRNYVGQICDMYLTQAEYHNVAIKTTLDEIRREVLYFNDIQEKLDQSDKKKLNNYLKNLD